MPTFLQFLFSGLTVGATYALVALGFIIIYNASHVINFAQGEFVMLGGMGAALSAAAGVPLVLAIPVGIGVAAVTGLAVEKFCIEPARGADHVTLIIITIGASLVIRGVVQVMLGKGTHRLESFSGDAPFNLFGATLLPQSLWVLGIAAVAVAALGWFFNRTLAGKAMRATAHNLLAARLVGVNTNRVLLVSFGLSAVLGAVGGIVLAPITYTTYDIGVLLGVKGFVAAVLGGITSGTGAVVGGLLLGVLEAMTAGYISSAYKDAVPFVLILLVLFVRPQGMFGRNDQERV